MFNNNDNDYSNVNNNENYNEENNKNKGDKYCFNYINSPAITGTKFSGASSQSTSLTDFNISQNKQPITSIGIIPFTYDNFTKEIKYLMIKRKHSVGFIDFIRGKYTVHNKNQLISLLRVMTEDEHIRLLTDDFSKLWNELWGDRVSIEFKKDELTAKDKLDTLRAGITTNYNYYTLADCIKEANVRWRENDWGFPKGRKNFNETDLACALREFHEETGIHPDHINIVANIIPYEEIFTGSNFKSYKHKYYLGYIENSANIDLSQFQRDEVGDISWKTLDECNRGIRDYHVERKNMLQNVDMTIRNLKIFI